MICYSQCIAEYMSTTVKVIHSLIPQWAEALAVFTQAADLLGMVSRKSLWGQFWSSHQRFFKYLCIAAKVRRLVELAKMELEAGKVGIIRHHQTQEEK